MLLAWQQKVFSRSEFRRYANAREEDFDSPIKKKFVCDARRAMADGFVPKNRRVCAIFVRYFHILRV